MWVSKLFSVYAYWVCAARETPFLALNFRSGAYNFLHIFKYSAPEQAGASPFYSFCRSRENNFRNFVAHDRLTQPRSASSLRSPALSRPNNSCSLRRGAFFTLPRRSGLAAGQNASQTRPTVRFVRVMCTIWKHGFFNVKIVWGHFMLTKYTDICLVPQP